MEGLLPGHRCPIGLLADELSSMQISTWKHDVNNEHIFAMLPEFSHGQGKPQDLLHLDQDSEFDTGGHEDSPSDPSSSPDIHPPSSII